MTEHMKGPVVSVLLPTYNRPDFLKDAIASVVAQEMTRWELLVINDGGTDVGDIVESFADSRIRYFNDTTNRGKSVRLNFGLRTAKGRYIAYLDDDDIWYPTHLRLLAGVLDENPEVGAAYSDLYAVCYIPDPATKARYPLHKYIQVCRDYNRDFMFQMNHILHVSFMHRRELAQQAGGYDEDVTVLIDWNMTRKLSFITDFKHVPAVTGEYYMPMRNSDRISVRERKDQDRFKFNILKIKGYLPPKPWPMVDSVVVIFPVDRWSEEIVEKIQTLLKKIHYPVQFAIVNCDPACSRDRCENYLGRLIHLQNLQLVLPDRPVSGLAAYRYGAQLFPADYYYLPSKKAREDIPFRIVAAREFLQRSRAKFLKWGPLENKAGLSDAVVKGEVLSYDDAKGGLRELDGLLIHEGYIPSSLKCDLRLEQVKKEFEHGNYRQAYQRISEAMAVEKGGAGLPFLMEWYVKVCFQLKKYEEAKKHCKELIAQGYGAENWFRLGRIYQYEQRYNDAVAAYRKGLDELGLKEEYLNSAAFPLAHHEEWFSFIGMVEMGHCLMELGDDTGAARIFRFAAKLKIDSARPWIGFARLFLKTGQYKRAEEAIRSASRKNKSRQWEVPYLRGRLKEARRQFRGAFADYLAAHECDPSQRKIFIRACDAGIRAGLMGDVENRLRGHMEDNPGDLQAVARLATILLHRSKVSEAEHLLRQGLILDPENEALSQLLQLIQQSRAA